LNAAREKIHEVQENQLNKELVRQVFEGRLDALDSLKRRVESTIYNRLLARGATDYEADEVLSAVWASAIPGMRDGRQSLFAAYKGQSSPTTWLYAVTLNRWLDRKRKDLIHARWASAEQYEKKNSPGDDNPVSDDTLLTLLRDSLKTAFRQCDAESLVLLRLVHVHGLSQRALASTWNLPEYSLSRRLTKTMKQIRETTLGHISKTDSWLDLKWEDFLQLCQQFSDDMDANSPSANV
jgi:RNA polymerase sigma factor (sigma-70 family)